MSLSATRAKEPGFLIGLALAALSFTLFAFSSTLSTNDSRLFGFFLLNYFIAFGYFLHIWWSGKLKRRGEGRYYFLINLVQFLISAYALNRVLPVFSISVPWLSVVLVVVSIACLSLFLFAEMPVWLRHIVMFCSGVALLLFLYLAIYLLPLYPFSIIGLLAIGISFHSYVPALLLIFLVRHILGVADRALFRSLAAGIFCSVVLVIFYCVQWTGLNNSVRDIQQRQLIAGSSDLPDWISLAQKIPQGKLTEKYLKTDLVYGTSGLWNESGWSFPGRNFDEVKKHDPLIVIASLFVPSPQLNRDERIRILEASYDARHQTQERLWSGENLRTENVITNARIYPDLRLAYTEKTITVQNSESNQGWQNREEAIYTFHLPQGSVVTSLSLWIEGKEQKGILTSTKKADSAYKTIVGVESRDPSLVHWQEGNTVSVRVFPVLTGEHRFFKIGVTSPLIVSGKTLSYKNIWFAGPEASEAQELIQLAFDKQSKIINAPSGLKKAKDGFTSQGDYQSDWQIQMEDPGLRNGVFSFGENSYTLMPAQVQRQAIAVENIYLDVNASWTEKDFEEILAASKGKRAFIYIDGMQELQQTNSKDLFREASSRQFSLFPFYLVKDELRSLIITKGGSTGPNVRDLKSSLFAAKMEKVLKEEKKFYVCNIGEDLSPFLKTLREHRALHYSHGNVQDASSIIAGDAFVSSQEDAETIAIDDAGVSIRKALASSQTSAPDHLMRLFVYNHVLQAMKGSIFSTAPPSDSLVAEAEKAYVVTPLSSLVVLEKQSDYDRFNIAKSKDALDNASLNDTGAVPEPGTWLLLIVVAGTLLFIKFRERLRNLIRQ